MTARVVSPAPGDDDAQFEAGLRPRRLDDYIGQDRVRENLQVSIAAARQRGEALDHILLWGPPGLGKTTLAYVIANEMGTAIRTTSGPVIEKPGDLAGMLQQAGLVDTADHEFLAEWSYTSAEEYYTSLMAIAAPVQNLMAKLSADQQQRVKQLILEAVSRHRRGDRIVFPIAVRMVAARKPF